MVLFTFIMYESLQFNLHKHDIKYYIQVWIDMIQLTF